MEGESLISRNDKKRVPDSLQDKLIEVYHTLLQHLGSTRMEATIQHAPDFRGQQPKVEEYAERATVAK